VLQTASGKMIFGKADENARGEIVQPAEVMPR